MIVLEMEGSPGRLTRVVSGDEPAYLAEAAYRSPEGTRASQALVTVESGSIRFAHHTGDLSNGATPKGHVLQAGDVLRLSSPAQIATFAFVNLEAGHAGVIQFTPYW